MPDFKIVAILFVIEIMEGSEDEKVTGSPEVEVA
jgi:hypothetical protein